mmetsp:Transcript_39732/g.75968  ORF Transcript_39732/g.75968 Transcript_39732/m.75968 type:complete len:279 (+) Transcript_39732:384-1220(+)
MNMGDDICGAILNDLHRGLKQWKAQIGLWFSQQDADMIHAWIQAVLARAERSTAGQTFQTGVSLDPTEDDMKRLAYIQRHFVISTIDKAANNFYIMCKKHYLQVCLNELRQEVAYEPAVNVTENDLIQDGKSFCEEHEIRLPNKVAKVPNFRIRVKLHKEPVGFRFVAGSPNAPLTSVSKWLTVAFKAIMPDVDEQWARVVDSIPYLRQKTRKSWIIHDSKEVKTLLERCNSTRGRRTPNVHLATYDFTSMYTTLPLRDLKERLGNLLDSVYQHKLQT